MSRIDRQELAQAFAIAARKALVSTDLATQQRALFPAAESLSLLLPVPSVGDQVLAELGNFLVPGFKCLTLHGLDRLSACLQRLPQALGQDGSAKAQLCYAIGSDIAQASQGTSLVASLSIEDTTVAQQTHQRLIQLAAGLDSCSTTFASIQEAAACFLRGPLEFATPLVAPDPPAALLPISGNTCLGEHTAKDRDRPDDDDSDARSSLSAPRTSLAEVLDGEETRSASAGPSSSSIVPEVASIRRRTAVQGPEVPSEMIAEGTEEEEEAWDDKLQKAEEMPTATDDFWMSFSPPSVEARFARWHAEQIFLGDYLINLCFLYGMWAILHGHWYNLAQDLPNTWWLCYTPALWVLPAVPFKWKAVGNIRGWYLAHRSPIQTAMVMHIFLQHILVVAPTMMLPHHHTELLAEPWSSFTRLYLISMHMTTPLFNQVPFKQYLPRHVFIVLCGPLRVPAFPQQYSLQLSCTASY
ncbi:hypothetical protein WJX73_009541 [Symbiochloris irregularis]|uniref:Uncharacterized protein n=1 Tax=Symbiochloris irregularis TaxID=706552 RepID=A0AAW1NLU9_9CHLO